MQKTWPCPALITPGDLKARGGEGTCSNPDQPLALNEDEPSSSKEAPDDTTKQTNNDTKKDGGR